MKLEQNIGKFDVSAAGDLPALPGGGCWWRGTVLGCLLLPPGLGCLLGSQMLLVPAGGEGGQGG